MKGQLPEAIAEYRKASELDDDPFALAMLGQACARSGQRDEANKILTRLSEEAKSRLRGRLWYRSRVSWNGR